MRLSRRLQLHTLAVVVLVVVALLIFDQRIGWRDIVLPVLVAGAAAMVLAVIVSQTITRPMDELRSVTRSLATGSLLSRPPLSASGEVGELSTAIHRLAEQLGMRMVALQSEDALLTALIEALNEGVFAVGPSQLVVRINQSARDLLRIQDRTPFPVDRLPRVPALGAAVQEALKGIITEPVECSIWDRTVSLTARPLSGGGAVIALFDLTRIRQLEVVRRDFVANVSHELRTPITVIGGFAETLADDDPPEQMRRQFASTIRAHAQRMQRIVDDLLDLSRLESGRWTPEISAIDVRSVARDAVTGLSRAAEEKGVTLEIDIDDSAATVTADRTAVRQVIANLAGNAVRHTDSGSVTIFSTRDGDGVWVGVRDTGRGIPTEHLSRIFERFYRVDDGRGRETGGTGLGLAIVKHLVEAHGGKVTAESEVGRGTRIAAFFPEAHSG
jgi:signal transduction histidine kinase